MNKNNLSDNIALLPSLVSLVFKGDVNVEFTLCSLMNIQLCQGRFLVGQNYVSE